MNARESAFWQWVNKRIDEYEGHATRIENSAECGTPDVEGCIKGMCFWLELKVADINTKGVKVKISRDQVMFLRARSHAGGLAYALIKTGRKVLFIRGGDDILLSLSVGARVPHKDLEVYQGNQFIETMKAHHEHSGFHS